MPGVTTIPKGYLTLAQVAREVGVSGPTAKKMVERFGIPLYAPAHDARLRLIRASDLSKLKEVRLVTA